MLLVVGLGNPGPRYAETRHNAGFMVVEELLRRGGGAFRSKFSGEITESRVGQKQAYLLKPTTYMNESGQSVRAVATFYKIPVSEILVIHDEIDLPFGELRLKLGGGDAGNRGIRSVTAHLGTPDYARLRFGIGRPPPDFRGDAADFVLEAFASAERTVVANMLVDAADAAEFFADRGLSAAMNTVNQRKAR